MTPAQTHSNLPSPDQIYASSPSGSGHHGTYPPSIPKLQSPVWNQIQQQKRVYPSIPPTVSNSASMSMANSPSSNVTMNQFNYTSAEVKTEVRVGQSKNKEKEEEEDEKKDVMSINSLLC